ncbi:MAG: acetate/propionate family kinase [Planctomycetota bacterium]|jgi:acetate kinase|nr:acetate/propionate family kinase [Planctomycetota bacterium]MDA1200049.1 acetate/propionate family kinase [Planctomycetota bacterium]
MTERAAEDRILVVNTGSSSVKCSLYRIGETAAILVARLHGDLRDEGCRLAVTTAAGQTVEELIEVPDESSAQAAFLKLMLSRAVALAGGPVAAVGHRVVHGGLDFTGPVVVDEAVLARLAALEPLAPLHQPHNLAGIRLAAALLPEAVQVACFDTAFHRTCPPLAMRFAIPRRWHDAGIRRYGFHGISYESVVERLPEITGAMPARAIVAHLGAGASLCGVRDGRSIATTMGFTPLDGLVMATRSGRIDPGAVLHLILAEGLSAAEVERILSRESGLLGVSGESGDMRTLLDSDDSRAAEAVELFCRRAVEEIGSLAAVLGGLDTLVFTAGIGEHAAVIRERICGRLGWLGLELDAAANAEDHRRISTASSRIAVWVIPTDEEAVIATATGRLRRVG